MKTVIIKLRKNQIKNKGLREAAEQIIKGNVVVFPTETVYGIGANALSVTAVKKIFELKGRPPDNPLIVHIAEKSYLHILTKGVPRIAEKLISEFWPGPLTLIFRKTKRVPKIVTGGLQTIAIRMPSHPVANMLILLTGLPVAAPSANISGFPSATRAKHVIDEFYGKVPVIIDGGNTDIGLESTVLNPLKDPPLLLRPGAVTVEQLEKIIGEIAIHPIAKAELKLDNLIAESPGMKYRHYAPRAKLILVEGPKRAVALKIQTLYNELTEKKKRVGLMVTDECSVKGECIIRIGSRKNLHEIAKNIFSTLREFDTRRVEYIIAEGVAPQGLGLAIMNRLRKAASERFTV